MPWQFNAQQLRRIQGNNQLTPEQTRVTLNGCSDQLQAFFNEKRTTTVLDRSGNRLSARLAALERLVAAMNGLNRGAPSFSDSNVSSMLSGSGGQFVPIVDEIITMVTPMAQGGPSPLAVLTQAGLSPKNVASILSSAGGNFPSIVAGISDLVTPMAQGGLSPLTVLTNAGLSTNNVASILSGARKNFPDIVKGIKDLVQGC